MRYAEAVEFLFHLQQFGASFGLDRVRKLAELAGNPQDNLRFIHVAGTNGKGSTCAILESIYRHAGLKTGLYTSPHLVSFAERIQVNRQLIPESDVARLTERMRDLLGQFPEGQHATFFEVVTVMALCWFAEQKCDLVIWETGLGGRLDATNIVTPLASVITNIQHDHQKWLGHTLAEIAREKAGIIKPGVPVCTAVESEEAWREISDIAARQNAPIFRLLNPESIKLPLAGAHQQRNAGLALSVVRSLPIAVSEQAIREGLARVHWPGRFDIRGRFILDGAHNPEGAAALRETLQQLFPNRRPAFIIGILADKDIPAIFRELAPVAGRVFTVPVNSNRSADAQLLAREFKALAPQIDVQAVRFFADAIHRTHLEPLTVITGSLHFIGEAMEFLHFETGAPGERSLNDWSGAPQYSP
jgi:dihydrofolate synthase/folylpolyglutamate synthase